MKKINGSYPIKLSEHSITEKNIQELILRDPNLIGIGSVKIIERERRQKSGKILDFLLSNEDDTIRFEVEIQIGELDLDHIIRCFHYFISEEKREPDKIHIPVLIAEHIKLSKYYDVIERLNKVFPLIPIEIKPVITADEQYNISFEKIDIGKPPPAIEQEIKQKETIRKSRFGVDWEYCKQNFDKYAISLVSNYKNLLSQKYNSIDIILNETWVRLEKDGKPIVVFGNLLKLKNKTGGKVINISISYDDLDELLPNKNFIINILESSNISYKDNPYQNNSLLFSIQIPTEDTLKLLDKLLIGKGDKV
jgi:hypothetical protein